MATAAACSPLRIQSVDFVPVWPKLNDQSGLPNMTAIRSRLRSKVVSDPSVMSGELVVRGTRVPAATIAAYLAAGRTDREVFEDYPSLPVDAIEAVRRWKGPRSASG
jgi:uncharacterized protein (DUF433 family)